MIKNILFLMLGIIIFHISVRAQQSYKIDKFLPTQMGKHKAEEFGKSTAIDGSYAVVGAPSCSGRKGAVLVYHNNGNNWEPIAHLTAADGNSYDYFGQSVSISGNQIIVGAYGDDDKGSKSGSVYVFEKHQSKWIQKAKLTASDGSSYDYFGYSVGISGDYIIVGADQDDNGKGSVYVFEKKASGWIQTEKLTASCDEENDYFGHSVCISNDQIVVGAYRGNNFKGSVYVFEKQESGWVQSSNLTAPDAARNDYFGKSVSISGNQIAVGAYGNGNLGGATYVFEKQESEWRLSTKLIASDGTYSDCFGYSVSISDNKIVVGAYNDDDKGSESGSVYIFKKQEKGWRQHEKLTASDGDSNDYFGYSVSTSDFDIVVGACGDEEFNYNSGSAYFLKVKNIF